MAEAISTWLRPLSATVDPAGTIDWCRLDAMAADLDEVICTIPIGADLPAGTERSDRLRMIRHQMAQRGHLNTTNLPVLFQLFVQFVCGYRDLDLRDTTGLGHGRLIAEHATPEVRQQWIHRMLTGELAGIALTESHCGSRPAATRTQAVAMPDGSWQVSGRKTWISRLAEAAVFVVFFRDPSGQLAAAAIDAARPELRRQMLTPTGLGGWTWGILDLDAVPVRPERDLLDGDGMALLRQHFASYRPLVTATALGAAAAVFDGAAEGLADRHCAGDLPRVRDSALITLGRAHAQLTAAILGTCVAAQLADIGHVHAEAWSCEVKAHGVDTAYNTASELSLLVGAVGYQASSAIAKARRDLNGLLYADGIHASLYIHAGKRHLTSMPSQPLSSSGQTLADLVG